MNFENFFYELHGFSPFPWQSELAHLACEGEWPDYIVAPTGCGKTAAIDAAIFALAKASVKCRRIFYVVNRRIIVDEALLRAKRIAAALAAPRPNQPTVAAVADALRTLSGSSVPLDCTELRGGIFRDNSWVRSTTQPLVVTATVDQIGSRILFRGYGVSPSVWPIHAALTVNDSLILLDEAHISQPFAQTLKSVAKYHGRSNFSFVQMTATPPAEAQAVLRLTGADHDHQVLKPRLNAAKPARLIEAKSKKLVETIVEEAKAILESKPRSIAIMVNRVKTAEEVAEKLKLLSPTLLTGRIRPLDRDDLTVSIQTDLATCSTSQNTRLVVSTQCLEVGADLDFDALVTECASIDALRQRFGRLNRAGRNIPTQAVIIFPAETKDDDFIYGAALNKTWVWLRGNAETTENGDRAIDMGIHALPQAPTDCLAPTLDSPILLPAHLDAFCQTSPTPAVEPEVSLFLHGPQQPSHDIQICWRSDLPESLDDWPTTLALLPPLSIECMPLPIYEFKGKFPQVPDAIIWRGPENSTTLTDPDTLRPGDTIILSATTEFPDQAERAYLSTRQRRIMRLFPDTTLLDNEASTTLLEFIKSPNNDIKPQDLPKLLIEAGIEGFENPIRVDRYPDANGIIISCPIPLITDAQKAKVSPIEDSGDDILSREPRPVPLNEHLEHVAAIATTIGSANSSAYEALIEAARFHDLGKADERFQALLLGGDLNLAWAQPTLYAKSHRMPDTPSEHESARSRSTLPCGFRHEMLSVQLAQKSGVTDPLILHLIATHHGYARPFTPVVEDIAPPCVEVNGITLSSAERHETPAHRLDSGITDRFWHLTRQYGWWGLAFFEAQLRLTDWFVSAKEST